MPYFPSHVQNIKTKRKLDLEENRKHLCIYFTPIGVALGAIESGLEV